MNRVPRYHPALVSLHWLMAALIGSLLVLGFFSFLAIPNAAPEKIAVLRLHMAGGMLILALTAVRFIVRLCTSAPAPAATSHPIADRIAPLVHYGFYVLVVLMVVSGYATAILAGLPATVFGNSGDPLPPTFEAYPTWVMHACVGALLAALIVLHIAAALYHHFVRRDGLIRRMSWGRRVATSETRISVARRDGARNAVRR